jgi:hypothetical protein
VKGQILVVPNDSKGSYSAVPLFALRSFSSSLALKMPCSVKAGDLKSALSV